MPVLVGSCTACWLRRRHDSLLLPRFRLVYLMTDGAACLLPLAARSGAMPKDIITATVTCGHAFGGDYEAVNLYSAQCSARR